MKANKNRQKQAIAIKSSLCLSPPSNVIITAKKIRRPLIQEEAKKIERIFYTYREAQEFLNVSHETIRQLMKQGLPSHKIGRKRVFLIEDLIRWIKEH